MHNTHSEIYDNYRKELRITEILESNEGKPEKPTLTLIAMSSNERIS